jgi:plastocyanin
MRNRSPRWCTALALLVALTALSSCGGGSDTNDTAAPPPHDVAIVQAAPLAGPNAFTPTNEVISLASQSTVTWYNGDFFGYAGEAGTVHHLIADDGSTFDTGTLAPGSVFQATFSAPGTYTYHCEIHTGMTGTVTVNP